MSHHTKNRKIYRNSLLIMLVLPLLAFHLHKEYYSLTKIDYSNKEKAIQITMRLFTDDVDFVLSKHFDQKPELGTKKEISNADDLIELYLREKFNLNINKTHHPYKFLGKEFEKDAIYLFMEITEVNDVRQIQVQNSMLTEQFPEQENIIKVNINNQRKSLILTRRNDKGMLNFN